jgi:uncharacterized iron-regulated membrane protein
MMPEKKDGKAGEKGKVAVGGGGSPQTGKGPAAGGGPDQGPGGKKKPKGGGKPALVAFVNPYTGAVVEVFNRRESFFFQVEMLHRFLLTGNEGIGKTIVGVSTCFFFFILVTGLILWWPKTKNILRQRLKYKFNAGFKRLTHDLHLVTGFYTSLFLIITVMTGLVMAFNWVNAGIFSLTGSKMENPEPPLSVYQAQVKPLPVEQVLQLAAQKQQPAEFYSIRVPNDPAGVFAVNVLPKEAVETRQDVYFYDQYSGQLAGMQLASDKNTGQKIRSYVKPIHTGAIFGLPTKILSFIIVLLTFTFPITGVMMWLNRLKKNRSKRRKQLAYRA